MTAPQRTEDLDVEIERTCRGGIASGSAMGSLVVAVNCCGSMEACTFMQPCDTVELFLLFLLQETGPEESARPVVYQVDGCASIGLFHAT